MVLAVVSCGGMLYAAYTSRLPPIDVDVSHELLHLGRTEELVRVTGLFEANVPEASGNELGRQQEVRSVGSKLRTTREKENKLETEAAATSSAKENMEQLDVPAKRSDGDSHQGTPPNETSSISKQPEVASIDTNDEQEEEMSPADWPYTHCLNTSTWNFFEQDITCYTSNEERKSPCFTFRHRRNGPLQTRCLPYFLLIGWPKCGTSALFYYLSDHPDIQLNAGGRKEFDYFSHWYKVDATDLKYSSWFPRIDHPKKISVDASTEYAAHEAAPMLVRRLMPHARIACILRDPVDQYYSYSAMRRGVRDPDRFHEVALRDINQCTQKCGDKVWDLSCTKQCRPLGVPIYVDWLENWFQYFPRKHVLILQTEELWNDPLAALRQVERLLDFEPHAYSPDVLNKAVNVGGKGNIYDSNFERQGKLGKLTPMHHTTRKVLQGFYAPHNQRLQRLLGDKKWSWGY